MLSECDAEWSVLSVLLKGADATFGLRSMSSTCSGTAQQRRKFLYAERSSAEARRDQRDMAVRVFSDDDRACRRLGRGGRGRAVGAYAAEGVLLRPEVYADVIVEGTTH